LRGSRVDRHGDSLSIGRYPREPKSAAFFDEGRTMALAVDADQCSRVAAERERERS
jgi:hypothetical protein